MPIFKASEAMVRMALLLGLHLWGFSLDHLVLNWVVRVGNAVVLGRLVVEVVELVVEAAAVLDWR